MYHLYIDFTGPSLPSEQGDMYCLKACCAFTDYLFCIPIPNKEVETVVQYHLKGTYSLFRGSKVLISDNGTEIKNSLFAEVCKILNMTKHFLTTHLPSSNLVERHQSALKRCITKFCHPSGIRLYPIHVWYKIHIHTF